MFKSQSQSQSQSRLLPLLCALLLGALMPLSFAPFNLAFFAPIALMALLFLIEGKTPKFAGILGLAFGFGMFAWGIWWIRISLIEFGGAPMIFGVLITFILALYLSLYFAILTYVTAKSSWALPLKVGVLLPLVGMLLEYIRGHFLTGFPWLSLGYTFTDLPISSWIFPEMGALMASFWVYWFAGILFLLVRTLFIASERTLKGLWSALMPAILLFFGMGSMVLISAVWISDKIQKVDEPLAVALLQGNIAQELKFSEAQYYSILSTYLTLTEEVADRADLIIWPETAVPSFYEFEDGLGKHLRELSKAEQTQVMTGIFSGNGKVVRNSIVTYSDDLRINDQRYDKAHLVPFGEYIPFREFLTIFDSMIEIPFSDLSKGNVAQEAFTIQKENGVSLKAAASICYEAVFGDELREQGGTSDFLVNVSNDAWFGDSIGPWQHFQIARARSIELQKEMLRATNNGITALVGKDGAVKSLLPQFEEGVLEVNVTSYIGKTGYSKLGDLFWVFMAVAGIILGLIGSRMSKRRAS